MSDVYKSAQNIINKCSQYSVTNTLNSSYHNKLIENKDYYSHNIDCIELQTLYKSILNKHMIDDNYNKSR